MKISYIVLGIALLGSIPACTSMGIRNSGEPGVGK